MLSDQFDTARSDGPAEKVRKRLECLPTLGPGVARSTALTLHARLLFPACHCGPLDGHATDSLKQVTEF